MPISGLIFRQQKGSPLTIADGDGNLKKIRDAFNALEQLFGVVLRPDGTLKPGAVGSSEVLADGVVTLDKLAPDARPPAGSITMYAGLTIPEGWLECNGQTVSRTTYADLFAAIGTAGFGAGDGSTTFHLPNLKGRVPVGSGSGAGLTPRVLATEFGEEKHLLTAAESGLPAHTHPVPWRHNTSGSGSNNDTGTLRSSPTETLATSASTAANAVEAHENCQPSIVLTYIIKI